MVEWNAISISVTVFAFDQRSQKRKQLIDRFFGSLNHVWEI
jgi:hypothetical protein